MASKFRKESIEDNASTRRNFMMERILYLDGAPNMTDYFQDQYRANCESATGETISNLNTRQ